MSDIIKWMGVIAFLGIVLMIAEYRVAKKKKEGFTVTDRQRILGILWLTGFFALLVGGIMWMAD